MRILREQKMALKHISIVTILQTWAPIENLWQQVKQTLHKFPHWDNWHQERVDSYMRVGLLWLKNYNHAWEATGCQGRWRKNDGVLMCVYDYERWGACVCHPDSREEENRPLSTRENLTIHAQVLTFWHIPLTIFLLYFPCSGTF